MTILHLKEYKNSIGETINIQFSVERDCWEVGCWDKYDKNRWYKEFDNEQDARKEYERWK